MLIYVVSNVKISLQRHTWKDLNIETILFNDKKWLSTKAIPIFSRVKKVNKGNGI